VAAAREITALCFEDYTKHVLCAGKLRFLALPQTVFMLIMCYKRLRNFYRICNSMEFCSKYTLTVGLLLKINDFYNGNKKIYLCVEYLE
jgi:hypothetical protein